MRSSCADSQFREGPRQLRGVRRLVMPVELVLHETDALALDRVRYQHGRFPCLERHAVQCIVDLPVVMAVDLAHAPAEGTPFVGKGLKVQHFLDGSKALDLVVINQGNQVVEPMMWRKEHGLPDRPLAAFAVAYK